MEIAALILSRVIANMASVKGIPCCVISPNDEDDSRIETYNSRMVQLFGARIVTCSKKVYQKQSKLFYKNMSKWGLVHIIFMEMKKEKEMKRHP